MIINTELTLFNLGIPFGLLNIDNIKKDVGEKSFKTYESKVLAVSAINYLLKKRKIKVHLSIDNFDQIIKAAEMDVFNILIFEK